MPLTPDDIVNYPLKQAVRGYSVAQVDELLDQVADTVERLTDQNEELQRRVRQAEDRLAAASETEATLKRTLVTAQRAAEQSLEDAKERSAELLDEARREAAGIQEQARLDAEELRVEALQAARAEEADIRRRRQALEGHIEALRIFEREYRSRLRGHLEDQLRMLDEVETRPQGSAGRAVTERPDEDEPPVEDTHLGGATVPAGAPLKVRVREGDDDGDREPDDADGEVGSASSWG